MKLSFYELVMSERQFFIFENDVPRLYFKDLPDRDRNDRHTSQNSETWLDNPKRDFPPSFQDLRYFGRNGRNDFGAF